PECLDFGCKEGKHLSRYEDVFSRPKLPSVMLWIGVTTDWKKAPLIFIEEGMKVDH
ncbi:Hypothetical protein FKW44_004137, partial [Caligus rogercresseyi]